MSGHATNRLRKLERVLAPSRRAITITVPHDHLVPDAETLARTLGADPAPRDLLILTVSFSADRPSLGSVQHMPG